jgi:hypothetical protein
MQIAVTQEHIDQGVRGLATKCPVARAIKDHYAQVECHPCVGYSEMSIAFQNRRLFLAIRSNLARWIGDFDNLRRVQPITISLNLSKKTARLAKGNP